MNSKKNIEDKKIIDAANSHPTMAGAAASLKLSTSTFKRRAEKLGVYVPNQGSMGIARKNYKPKIKSKIPLQEILEGKHPSYGTGHLKKRLLITGIKKEICEGINCEVGNEWLGIKLVLHLDHIDGDPTNHKLNNLRILCPNCHTQTSTFAGKNKSNKLTEYEKEQRKIARNKYGNMEDYLSAVKTKWEKSQQEYIPLILQSEIDFTKFGWVGEAAKILDRPSQKVNFWMKRMMPEFYDNVCYKRLS